jgi:hypothetical protein
MASTTTTELGLFKPVPGSAEPFRTTDVNANWDLVDEAFTTAELKTRVQEVATEGITINGGTA